jgi:hypothetical protein
MLSKLARLPSQLAAIARHPLNRGKALAALLRWSRWQIDSCLVPGPVLVPFFNSYSLFAQAGMTGITQNIYVGRAEFREMAFLLHVLRPDDLFVDVGANIGAYTILAGPSAMGKYTLDLVYARVAPGVLKELQEREPKGERGRRKHHLHRWFTDDIGHPELSKHIFAVNTLMRANTSWDRFYRSMQRALPKQNSNLELNLTDNEGEPL